MLHTITMVEPESIADQLGIQVGDKLVSINGEKIIDFVDYQSLCAVEQITLTIERDGEETDYTFEKNDYESLGLRFDDDMIGSVRNCANHCVFCFVDQLPCTARETLRVKDDDWRLSLMMGNFVTLTNVSDTEFERIIKRRAAPLYISVHATDTECRQFLLGTKMNADILPRLQRMKEENLSFHAQAVLCPGINDGEILEKTIEDLANLWPACKSFALVPVGLTGHREGLYDIELFDRYGAWDVLDIVKKWQKICKKKFGSTFVHAADEFYLLGSRQFPDDDTYEEYPQIENGVGLCRMLETEYAFAHRTSDLRKAQKRKIIDACGVSVAGFMRDLFEKYPVPGVDVTVMPIKNSFFGESVTVSGLLTGSDLIRELKNVQADEILITECMLRDGENVFLDGLTLEEVSKALPCPLKIVGRSGEDLLEAITGMPLTWK